MSISSDLELLELLKKDVIILFVLPCHVLLFQTEQKIVVGKNPTENIFFFYRYFEKIKKNQSRIMSSQSCAICGPKRTSRALCNCCEQYLCP